MENRHIVTNGNCAEQERRKERKGTKGIRNGRIRVVWKMERTENEERRKGRKRIRNGRIGVLWRIGNVKEGLGEKEKKERD